MKTVTLKLADFLREARVVAAEEGRSISALLTDHLEAIVRERKAFDKAQGEVTINGVSVKGHPDRVRRVGQPDRAHDRHLRLPRRQPDHEHVRRHLRGQLVVGARDAGRRSGYRVRGDAPGRRGRVSLTPPGDWRVLLCHGQRTGGCAGPALSDGRIAPACWTDCRPACSLLLPIPRALEVLDHPHRARIAERQHLRQQHRAPALLTIDPEEGVVGAGPRQAPRAPA